MTERTKSNTIAAAEKLRGLIFSGELAADSNHLETELAERLGMSRTPVREASLMLAAQGLLQVQPRKGVRITAISAQDMAQIYEVLTELECLAVRRAAQAGLSSADLEPLGACIEQMEYAIASEDRLGWSTGDEAFHTELVRLGGNAHVEEIVRHYNDRVRRARAITLQMRPLPVKSNHDHRAVYEAILAGDGTSAEAVHRAHRTHAREMLTDLLRQSDLRGA